LGLTKKIEVKKIATLTGHTDSIFALCEGIEKNTFFSGSADGMVVKWDINNPDNGELIAKSVGSVYSLEILKSTNKLIIGQNHSGIHLLDLETKKEEKFIQLPSLAIFALKHVKNMVLAACGDGSVYIFSETDFKLIKHLKLSEKSARCIDYSNKENEIAIGFSDYSIQLLDADTLVLKNKIFNHSNSVFTLKYHPVFKHLISGGRDAHLAIWDYETQKIHKTIVAHLFAINDIAFSPDGNYFVSVSMDKSVKIWDANTYELLKVIDKSRNAGHGTSVNKVLWTIYEGKIVTCSDDKTISVWELNL
jgi:WD40 repeat protein